MKIEIDDMFAEQVVIQMLHESMEMLEKDLEAYEAGGHPFIAVFSTDPDEDVKRLKKQIKAFKRVLSWYEPQVTCDD
jgi:hypothetical protein